MSNIDDAIHALKNSDKFGEKQAISMALKLLKLLADKPIKPNPKIKFALLKSGDIKNVDVNLFDLALDADLANSFLLHMRTDDKYEEVEYIEDSQINDRLIFMKSVSVSKGKCKIFIKFPKKMKAGHAK